MTAALEYAANVGAHSRHEVAPADTSEYRVTLYPGHRSLGPYQTLNTAVFVARLSLVSSATTSLAVVGSGERLMMFAVSDSGQE